MQALVMKEESNNLFIDDYQPEIIECSLLLIINSLTPLEIRTGKSYLSNLVGKHIYNNVFINALLSYISVEVFNKELLQALNIQYDTICSRNDNSEDDDGSEKGLFYKILHYAKRNEQLFIVNSTIKKMLLDNDNIDEIKEAIAAESPYKEIQEFYRLCNTELMLLYFMNTAKRSLGRVFIDLDEENFFYGIALCTGITVDEARQRLDKNGRLVSCGLIKYSDYISITYEPNTPFIDLFKQRNILQCVFIEGNNQKQKNIEKFTIKKELIESALFVLSSDIEHQLALHGTVNNWLLKIACSLAATTNKKWFILDKKNVHIANESGETVINLLESFISLQEEECIVIVQNIETSLKTVTAEMYASLSANVKSKKIKLIWLTKDIRSFPSMLLQKVCIAINVGNIDIEKTENYYRKYLERLELPESIKNQIILLLQNKPRLHAGFKRFYRFLTYISKKQLPEKTIKALIIQYLKTRRILEAGGKQGDGSRSIFSSSKTHVHSNQSNPIRENHYSIDVLETSIDVSKLIKSTQNVINFSKKNNSVLDYKLLFYGPPGTGKTALAYHIARTVGREIVCYRYSDIVDPLLGNTEINIAKLFHRRDIVHKILLIDEIDSFLFKRGNAVRSWEISQVNEFLTQMDQFHGIFIATTNNFNILDEAVIRRFNQKVEFFALSDSGVTALLHTYFPNITFNDSLITKLLKHGPYYPSDFQLVEKSLQVADQEDINAENIVSLLIDEARVRTSGKPRAIGFKE